MAISRSAVEKFLRSYAVALGWADLDTIARAWHIPSLVVDTDASLAVKSTRAVRAFFKASVADYHARGIVAPQLEHFEVIPLARHSVAVTATWLEVRDDGRKAKREKSYYVLSRRDGRLGFDVAGKA